MKMAMGFAFAAILLMATGVPVVIMMDGEGLAEFDMLTVITIAGSALCVAGFLWFGAHKQTYDDDTKPFNPNNTDKQDIKEQIKEI